MLEVSAVVRGMIIHWEVLRIRRGVSLLERGSGVLIRRERRYSHIIGSTCARGKVLEYSTSTASWSLTLSDLCLRYLYTGIN